LIERYGSDAIRYFLLREIPFGQDGVFTPEAMVQRLNFDLANDLGNLVHRTAAMLNRFCGGVVTKPASLEAVDQALFDLGTETVAETERQMDAMQFSLALGAIWKLVGQANKYIDETAPWVLNKAGSKERLDAVMYTLTDTIRRIAVLIQPFLPNAAVRVFEQYGLTERETAWDRLAETGVIPSGTKVAEGTPLFPRLDVHEEIATLEALTNAANAAGARPAGETSTAKFTQGENNVQTDVKDTTQNQPAGDTAPAGKPQIGIDTFGQVELKVGQILLAERVEGADKLLRLEVDLGSEQRQIVSGIAKYFDPPSTLVGRKVVVVTNLKPVKLRGVQSNGMILAASEGDQLSLVTVSDEMPNGAVVK
jgi:methionyl-tRNA synthetase